MKKLLIANLIAICLLFLYFGFKEIQPALIYASHSDEYKELMYECDHAMREHYIAKMALELEASASVIPSSECILLLASFLSETRKAERTLPEICFKNPPAILAVRCTNCDEGDMR